MNKHDPYAAIKYPAFRLFMGFKFFITVALQIQAVVVGWQIYQITQDPLSLGLIGLAEVIPNISVTLFGGYIADLWNRKIIILICIALIIFTSIALSLNQGNSVPVLYVSICLTGFARGFITPSAFGLMTEVVPKTLYLNSSAWSSSLWQVAALIGAGIAGFLYVWLGFSKCYILTAILLCISFFCIFLIRYTYVKKHVKRDPIFASIKEGIHFVLKDQRILGAQLLDMFAVLFGGAVALLPVFAKDILLVGAQGLGFLRAVPSLGAMLMAIYLTRKPIKENAGLVLFSSVALFGVTMILFGISTNYYFSLFILFISGAIDNVSVIIRSTILQTLTPDNMKGRVSAVNSIFISSSNEIGAFESGVAAKIMGVVPSVIFGGSMTLLVVAITYKVAPKLKKLSF